jgi:pre-mRNA-splicing factor 38A
MTLLYLRLTIKAPELYEILEPFYVDNRKLRLKNSIGRYELTYIDKIVEDMLSQEICFGLSLPFIPKRLALEVQGLIEPRKSLIEE